jgi:hypothetical protein
MTFSLRLTADLTLALTTRAISTKQSYPPILRLSPDLNFQTGPASLSISSHHAGNGSSQPGALVPPYRSPIIWIAGAEPLDSPEVARFANALAASGRSVFLETSGTSLKRRLHEFQPSSRFYFAVRFDGPESSHDQRNSRDGAFRTGLEAIRMARLAGFFTCALLVLHPNAAASELEKLHTDISKLDVDGFLITRAAFDPSIDKNVTGLRQRLLSRRWALLSSLLDTSASPVVSRTFQEIERQPLSESQPGNLEEGAEAG